MTDTPLPPNLAIVIPAYHEERLLPRTLSRVPAEVALVVVVDDGSSDATVEVARTHAAEDARVVVVALEQNQGVGGAIMAGYAAAAARGAEILVVMAADDQMDPADLPALVARTLWSYPIHEIEETSYSSPCVYCQCLFDKSQ